MNVALVVQRLCRYSSLSLLDIAESLFQVLQILSLPVLLSVYTEVSKQTSEIAVALLVVLGKQKVFLFFFFLPLGLTAVVSGSIRISPLFTSSLLYVFQSLLMAGLFYPILRIFEHRIFSLIHPFIIKIL